MSVPYRPAHPMESSVPVREHLGKFAQRRDLVPQMRVDGARSAQGVGRTGNASTDAPRREAGPEQPLVRRG